MKVLRFDSQMEDVKLHNSYWSFFHVKVGYVICLTVYMGMIQNKTKR